MTNAYNEPIIKLPSVNYYQHTVPLTAPDRVYYERVEMACQALIARWIQDGELHKHQGAVLLFLLRLRQMSCHRHLIGQDLLEEIERTDWDAVDAQLQSLPGAALTSSQIANLQRRLRVSVEMGDDCPVCMEPLAERNPVITPCAHPFCRECVSAIILSAQTSQRGPLCPMDRQPLPRATGQLIAMMEKDEVEAEELASQVAGGDMQMSAKVRECLRIVNGTLSTDPSEKMLV